jgi:outer membrane protein assembly factor BamB
MTKIFALFFLAALSSATFAADIVGWRRDGTGIYPNTTPPTQWQQISKAVEGLRFQATPPQADAPSGKPMPDGVIREWLILGPLDAAKGDKGASTDPVNLDDQSALSPAANDTLAGAAWKPLKSETNFLDFAKLFDTYGKSENKSVYVHAYLFSPEPAAFLLNINSSSTTRIWINGKAAPKVTDGDISYSPGNITLQKGWNRILIRCIPVTGKAERPDPGQWYLGSSLRAMGPKIEFDQQNIRWKALLPAGEGGFGAPIVVQNKIFLLSEPADLVCLDARTGKILWVRSNNYDEFATPEEKSASPDVFTEIAPLQAKLKTFNDSFASPNPPKQQNTGSGEGYKEKMDAEAKLYKLMRQVDDKKYVMPKGQDVGYAGFTPVSDGKFVYAWFATGVTCCYDLDGKLIWRRLDNEGSFFEHGYSTSPILADGKLMVFMNNVIAFNAKTGDRLWTTKFSGIGQTRFHGTPAPFKIADTAYCVIPTGQFIRLSDGKMVHDKGPEISPRQQEIPSPVAIGNTLYELSTYGFFNKITLPSSPGDPLNPAAVQPLKVDVSRFPTYYLDWHLASPLIHDGLAYCVNNSGVLSVIDLASMQILYQKLLDIDHFQNTGESAGRGCGISPSLAGGNIYLVGNTGTTLVIKPGRTYQQLAKNKIESLFYRRWATRLERFVAAPTFDGNCIYLRGERYLYCLGTGK